LRCARIAEQVAGVVDPTLRRSFKDAKIGPVFDDVSRNEVAHFPPPIQIFGACLCRISLASD
jgi:hypothetical protein